MEKPVQGHDLITADNFKSTFVYLHMLASRQMSLESMLDGLTFVFSCLSVETSPDDNSDLPELDESGLFSLGLSL